MYKYFIFFVYLLITLFACQSEYKQTSSYTPNTVAHDSLTHLYPLKGDPSSSYHIKMNQIIPLQTHLQSLIVSISKVMIIGDTLYIMDKKTSSFKAFDVNGNYLFDIGKIGKGPGEYVRIYDFDYDTINNCLWVYTNENMRLIAYSLMGEFIKDIEVPFYGSYFTILDSNHYAFYINYNTSSYNHSSNLLLTNSALEVQQAFFPYSPTPASISFSGFLSKNKEGALIAYAFSDTIFQITQGTIYPKYVVDFEGFQPPTDIMANLERMMNKLIEYSYLASFDETENSLYFSYDHQRYWYKAFWLKNSAKLFVDNSEEINSFLDLINVVGTYGSNIFIGAIYPSKLHTFQRKNPNFMTFLKQDFKEIYDEVIKLEETDNPLIVLFEISDDE